MPNGTLPITGYLGDVNRTTSEFQGGIDELLAYVKTLKAEVDALSAQVIKEAAVRGVGSAAGNVPDTAVLNTRLGTTGNLGTAAVKAESFFLPATQYQEQTITLDGDFSAGQQVKVVRIGNSVTVGYTGTGSLGWEHISTNRAETTTGLIPSWARPPQDTDILWQINNIDVFYILGVSQSGVLKSQYIDITGADISRVNSLNPPQMTYVV